MLYNILAVIFSLILPLLILIKPVREYKNSNKNLKGFFKENKYIVISYCILVLGFILRSVAINRYPARIKCR